MSRGGSYDDVVVQELGLKRYNKRKERKGRNNNTLIPSLQFTPIRQLKENGQNKKTCRQINFK